MLNNTSETAPCFYADLEVLKFKFKATLGTYYSNYAYSVKEKMWKKAFKQLTMNYFIAILRLTLRG